MKVEKKTEITVESEGFHANWASDLPDDFYIDLPKGEVIKLNRKGLLALQSIVKELLTQSEPPAPVKR